MCQWPYCLTCSGHIPWHHYISKMLSESYYLMIIHRVSIIGEMQRGCMETAALVLNQKTFSFHRKLNLNFMQKNFFYQSCVCKVVEPMFETGFWPFYWVSSGGWWLYRLMYPHRFSGSKRKYLIWLNMLGFVNMNKILSFFPVLAATPTSLYFLYCNKYKLTSSLISVRIVFFVISDFAMTTSRDDRQGDCSSRVSSVAATSLTSPQ